jgi:hypothetical protein
MDNKIVYLSCTGKKVRDQRGSRKCMESVNPRRSLQILLVLIINVQNMMPANWSDPYLQDPIPVPAPEPTAIDPVEQEAACAASANEWEQVVDCAAVADEGEQIEDGAAVADEQEGEAEEVI